MVAELGGYTGMSSGGPPGTITLARGLFRLRDAADTLRAMHSHKMRRRVRSIKAGRIVSVFDEGRMSWVDPVDLAELPS